MPLAGLVVSTVAVDPQEKAILDLGLSCARDRSPALKDE
jgi:hypothetical protein